MDLMDIVDLRTTTPFDATDFRKRWEIMMAWKAYRYLQDPDDQLFTDWEAEKRIDFDIILTRTEEAPDAHAMDANQFSYPDSP